MLARHLDGGDRRAAVAAAGAAAPLLRAELARRRRHTAVDNGWSSDQIPVDLALLSASDCALAATTAQ